MRKLLHFNEKLGSKFVFCGRSIANLIKLEGEYAGVMLHLSFSEFGFSSDLIERGGCMQYAIYVVS